MSDDALREEHNRLRAEAFEKRRQFARTEGRFAKAMTQAVGEYLAMRENGVPREDAVKGLEAVLRDTWPGRTSKFSARCDRCDDCGWAIMHCTYALRCGRKSCSEYDDTWEHMFAVACDCEAGDRFRHREHAPVEVLTEVGRRKRTPRKWTPVGQP